MILFFYYRYHLSRIVYNIGNKPSTIHSKAQHVTTKTDNEEDDDQPIKYSQSKAATMRINEYRDPYGDNMPWYQPPIVSISIAVFLIYFCILREENDLDLMLTKELGDHLNENKASRQSK